MARSKYYPIRLIRLSLRTCLKQQVTTLIEWYFPQNRIPAHWISDAAARLIRFTFLLFVVQPVCSSPAKAQSPMLNERQITNATQGHMLTNIGVWSPDSKWIVYDTRSSLDGSQFNGQTIERVEVATGRVELLYRSSAGACCGVVTYHPSQDRVVFILGPQHPTEDWSYSPTHRQGVIVDCTKPQAATNLDARDLTAEFTPGALRGGTHVHTFNHEGTLVASTYEDAVLEQRSRTNQSGERNLRGVAICLLGRPVSVPDSHLRNHSGRSFTVLATRLHDAPLPGSDQIERACEESWIGNNGYVRTDGKQQKHAIAFQGTVIDNSGQRLAEVFVLDLPNELDALTQPGTAPLQGTSTLRPSPPRGVSQRRLTFTEDRKFPGLAQPRHWLRTSADGQLIAFLAKDDQGIVQVFGVNPNGGSMRQLTFGEHSVSSAISFSPDGAFVAYVADSSIFITNVSSGQSQRLTAATPDNPPRPEACVFSPNGKCIAYMRTLLQATQANNQVFVVTLP